MARLRRSEPPMKHQATWITILALSLVFVVALVVLSTKYHEPRDAPTCICVSGIDSSCVTSFPNGIYGVSQLQWPCGELVSASEVAVAMFFLLFLKI